MNVSLIAAITVLSGGLSLTACGEAAAPLVDTTPPKAAVSLEWLERTGTLVAAGRMSPLAAGRAYAAVSVAQYQAAKSTEPAPIDEAAFDGRLGAVTAASVQVLSFLFPTAADSLGRMLNERTAALSGARQTEFVRGVAIGRQAGDAVIANLKVDGFTRAWTGSAPTGTGMWIPVTNPPAGVTLGSAKPYFLTSGAQFRPAPPPAFGSAAFNTDLNEVVTATANRTADQLNLAKAWDYSAGTTTPVGYWNKAARDYIANGTLDEVAAARILALMHAVVYDAQIACFEAKYHYWTIRPYQADTNVALALAAPNHPAYPSGHSCVSSSAARVLQEFFPSRTTELNQLVTDAGMSRVYAGIHYRFDIVAGQQLGKAVAEYAISKGTF
jgi:membrane-associated phospholipid phosphatase